MLQPDRGDTGLDGPGDIRVEAVTDHTGRLQGNAQPARSLDVDGRIGLGLSKISRGDQRVDQASQAGFIQGRVEFRVARPDGVGNHAQPVAWLERSQHLERTRYWRD